MIGQDPQPSQPQIEQNLAADAEDPPIHRLNPRRHPVGPGQVRHVDVTDARTADPQQTLAKIIAGTLRPQVHQRPPSRFLDHPHRRAKLLTRRVGGFIENIAQQIAPMHANQDGLFDRFRGAVVVQIAHPADRQRDVRQRIDRALIRDEIESALGRFDRRALYGLDPLDQPLLGQSMLNDLLDRAHLEVVLGADGFKVSHAGHVAVLAHDFDQHRAGVQPREPRQINRAFGLTRTHQHPALARPQRIDVPGTNEIVGRGSLINQQLDRLDAIEGRDPRAHPVPPVPVNRDGQRRTPGAGVRRRLGNEIQPIAVGGGQRHAKIARPDARHEVDDLRRHLLSSADEIPLVLAVLIVHEHDDSARSKLIKDLWNR